jgi:ribosomal protein S18 acetylase RimI-like enzyme
VAELRPAVADDAPGVARIYVDSWNRGFGHLMGVRELTEETVARWRADLSGRTTEWTLAELDGEMVGFVGTGPSRDPIDPTVGEVDTIAVAPTHWRRGVGRALMTHAVERLQVTWPRAILWTPAKYDRGHAFYRAMDWHPLGRDRAGGTEVAFGREL